MAELRSQAREKTTSRGISLQAKSSTKYLICVHTPVHVVTKPDLASCNGKSPPRAPTPTALGWRPLAVVMSILPVSEAVSDELLLLMLSEWGVVALSGLTVSVLTWISCCW